MSFLYTFLLFAIFVLLMPDLMARHLTSGRYTYFVLDVLASLGLFWLMFNQHVVIQRFIKPKITKTSSVVDEIEHVKFSRPTLVESTTIKYPFWLLDPKYSYFVKMDLTLTDKKIGIQK